MERPDLLVEVAAVRVVAEDHRGTHDGSVRLTQHPSRVADGAGRLGLGSCEWECSEQPVRSAA